MEGKGEMGRSKAVLRMCHLCPSKLCHGWDEMDLDVTPAGHRGTKSHQRAVVEDTGNPWKGHPCPGMLCLDTLRPWTALSMWDEALWSTTSQDVLELIPPRPVWGQKAAFGLVLGLMQLLLGIFSLLLGIYILYIPIVCIYTVEVGKGLSGSAGMVPKKWDWMSIQGTSGTPLGMKRALDLGSGDSVD